jgi:ABC-2 type transport system permease protein
MRPPLSALVARELKALWQDPWQLALVSYLPLLGILMLWWLFSAGLPRALPVALVDQDMSQLSRSLARNLAASPVITPISYPDLLSAQQAMKEAKVYAMVVLPYGFRKDLLTAKQPVIDIRYNGQFLLVGKLLASQIQQSLGAGLSELAGIKQMAAGVPKVKVETRLRPVTSQVTPLFNMNNNYLVFLLPPVLIALGQLLAMLVFANSLSREVRLGMLAQCYRAGIWRVIAVKFLLYTPLLILQGRLILAVLYQYLALPLAGKFGQLLLAQLLMVSAVWLIVLAIFFLLLDATRMVSFCTALFAPAFPFMGITFPTQNMPILAQWWRQIMPSSHYIETHVGVVSYGQSWFNMLQQVASYWGFLLLIPLIFYLVRRQRKALGLCNPLSPSVLPQQSGGI